MSHVSLLVSHMSCFYLLGWKLLGWKPQILWVCIVHCSSPQGVPGPSWCSINISWMNKWIWVFAYHCLRLTEWEVVGTSLVVQWLRFCTSTAGVAGSIPGQGTKILHASVWPKKKKKSDKWEVVNSNMSRYKQIIQWVVQAWCQKTSDPRPQVWDIMGNGRIQDKCQHPLHLWRAVVFTSNWCGHTRNQAQCFPILMFKRNQLSGFICEQSSHGLPWWLRR